MKFPGFKKVLCLLAIIACIPWIIIISEMVFINSFRPSKDSIVNDYMKSLTRKDSAADPISQRRSKLVNLKNLAKSGDAESQYQLGILYNTGDYGIQKNKSRAFAMFNLAANQEHAKALLRLVSIHARGEIVRKNQALADSYLIRAAKTGDLQAVQLLANEYELRGTNYHHDVAYDDPEELETLMIRLTASGDMGRLIGMIESITSDLDGELQPDPKKAEEIYSFLAQRGDCAAMIALGNAYLDEAGLAKDLVKGIQYYEMAAASGADEMYSVLGDIYNYAYIDGISRDLKKAIAYYSAGAEQSNDIGSREHLAHLYSMEDSPVQDYQAAFIHYNKLLENPVLSTYASLELGGYYILGLGTSQDPEKGLEIARPGLERFTNFRTTFDTVDSAAVRLGQIHTEGIQGVRNYKRADALFHFAADAGNIEACYELGMLYKSGIPQLHDLQKAHYWLEKAAHAGNIEAQIELAQMRLSSEYEGTDSVSILVWMLKAANNGNEKALKLSIRFSRSMEPNDVDEALRLYGSR